MKRPWKGIARETSVKTVWAVIFVVIIWAVVEWLKVVR